MRLRAAYSTVGPAPEDLPWFHGYQDVRITWRKDDLPGKPIVCGFGLS
jgi:hypothetical protein